MARGAVGLLSLMALVAAACSESAGVGGAVDGAVDAGTGDAAACQTGPERNGPYSPVSIRDNPGAKGAFDPSVVYLAGAPLGLMTYTTVPDEAHDYIAIATSTDAGATWQYAAAVTSAKTATITTSNSDVCSAAECTGTFIHETSSLLIDPTDPVPERRLKMFVHSYFFGRARHLELGYLALYTAAAPEGPWTETKLLGWNSDSPISSDGVRYNVSTDPALSDLRECLILGEPGALYREPGIIELSLSCVAVSAGAAAIDVRLLRSRDHGETWSYVSTLLTPDDAIALGSTERQINGSALLYAGGKHHLIVSPAGIVDFPDGPAVGYRGCVVVPIADLESGAVERCDGKPVIEEAYRGQPRQFAGGCSADVGAASNGMLISVPDFSTPAAVHYGIFAAGMPLP